MQISSHTVRAIAIYSTSALDFATTFWFLLNYKNTIFSYNKPLVEPLPQDSNHNIPMIIIRRIEKLTHNTHSKGHIGSSYNEII